MKTLPATNGILGIRVDFSDQRAWEAIRRTVETPNEEGFLAMVEFVSDPAFTDMTAGQLLALVPEDYEHAILVVVDKTAIASAEMPVLVIDLVERRGREIRVVATELWSIENNLSLANMSFDEFADSADEDGIFRGF